MSGQISQEQATGMIAEVTRPGALAESLPLTGVGLIAIQ
jgi:hypothetical protein